jgi:hypothetical protein
VPFEHATGTPSPFVSKGDDVNQPPPRLVLGRPGRSWQSQITRDHPMIITVTSARQKKMILWPPMIVYPTPVGLDPARPVAQGRQVSPAHGLARRG